MWKWRKAAPQWFIVAYNNEFSRFIRRALSWKPEPQPIHHIELLRIEWCINGSNELIEFDWLHLNVMYAAMPIAKWWQETIIDRFYLLFTLWSPCPALPNCISLVHLFSHYNTFRLLQVHGIICKKNHTHSCIKWNISGEKKPTSNVYELSVIR